MRAILNQSIMPIYPKAKRRSRRTFIKKLAFGSSFFLTSSAFSKVLTNDDRLISCQQYPWHTFLEREGKDWFDSLSESFDMLASVPFYGFEPLIEDDDYTDDIIPYLKKHNLVMESLYMGPLLHDRKEAPSNIKNVLSIADKVHSLGTRIFVINPEPIDWDGNEDKTDEQLNIQAEFLNELGRELNSRGIQLAYHNHHNEIRNGAKEFYHVMENTDSSNVKLCLDAHWIYRGAGNITTILSDVLEKYIDRIIELHLRQSQGGIWTESFGEGDIDYVGIAANLKSKNIKPLLVLEQAVEDGSQVTMSPIEAHMRSIEYVKKIFTE